MSKWLTISISKIYQSISECHWIKPKFIEVMQTCFKVIDFYLAGKALP